MLDPKPYIEIARMPHDALAALVRRPCGDRTMAVLSPCTFRNSCNELVQLIILIEIALQTCKTKIQHKADTPVDSNNYTS